MWSASVRIVISRQARTEYSHFTGEAMDRVRILGLAWVLLCAMAVSIVVAQRNRNSLEDRKDYAPPPLE